MNKNLHFMDTAQLNESSVFNLGYNYKESYVEAQRLNLSNILKKKSKLKIRSSLTSKEQKTLK